MRIAVLTLTRDRLAYTKHCFAKLRENAGCDFDWYVLDQGSQDGTREWLLGDRFSASGYNQGESAFRAWGESVNVGISRGMNILLDHAFEPWEKDYDVIVKIDNDCELTEPNTLRDTAQLAHIGNCLLSPRILGLRNPPQPMRELRIGDETILDIPQIGGIFLAAPAWIYDQFRYSEDNPPWGGDDVELCHWFRSRGGTCGYVKRLTATHYETTDGQHIRYPDYFDRTRVEGKAVL